MSINNNMSEPKKRVANALKRALEGELISSAYAPSRNSLDTHSKTGVSHHSKGGNDHSKATADYAKFIPDSAQDARYERFASELAKIKSEVDMAESSK